MISDYMAIENLTGSSTAITSNYIANINTVYSYLNSSTGTTGSLSAAYDFLQTINGWASDRIESHCRKKIVVQQLLGVYDGDGTNILELKNYPQSIISVKIRNSINDSWTDVTADIDFVQNNYNILLKNKVFPCGDRTVQIQYFGGYSKVPKDIEQVATEIIVINFKKSFNNAQGGSGRIGIISENSGGGTNSGITYTDLTDEHLKILDKYKRTAI